MLHAPKARFADTAWLDGARGEIERIEREMRVKFAELDDAYEFVLRVNKPTVMPEGNFDRLHESPGVPSTIRVVGNTRYSLPRRCASFRFQREVWTMASAN